MKLTNCLYKTLIGLSFTILFSCDNEVPDKFVTENGLVSITDYLYENEGEYSSFIRIVEESGMKSALSAYNPTNENYTLFLPTNNAFDLLFKENDSYNNIEDLIADKDYVYTLARYHTLSNAVEYSDFPLGAFADTCLSGDKLVISYATDGNNTIAKINNTAIIKKADIEMFNGLVHVIDHVLEPVTFSAYEWVRKNSNYSIMADLLDLTGLKDTLGIQLSGTKGEGLINYYTLMVEPNEVFNRDTISNLEDLIAKYSPDNKDYTDPSNALYQFAAYHILEGSTYLSDLNEGTGIYNTYADLPMQIYSGIEIKVNKGVEIFDSILVGSGVDYIDYINLMISESNVQTKTGPIHVIDRVMEVFNPGLTARVFSCYEEPLIRKAKDEKKSQLFLQSDPFTILEWTGVEDIQYIKTDDNKIYDRDYIRLDGDFTLTYKLPKIQPGKYGIHLRAYAYSPSNATIQVFLDGKKIGGNFNLTSGGTEWQPFGLINIGIVDFVKYQGHTIEIKSLIPGLFYFDALVFQPSIKNYLDKKFEY